MAKIEWSMVGERVYEAGVDHGVLYTGGGAGVPWNGLVSINETSSGGEPEDFYIDGVKYLSLNSAEEFGATIEAFTYPAEFARCDGTARIKYGLFAAQQSRQSFGLSYRTKIGNDVDGMDHGYKLHLIYNATAAPSSQSRTTIGESVEAGLFSWEVTTKPPPLSGYNATAHFVIDSRETPTNLMRVIEEILYGTTLLTARLPTVQELVALFNAYVDTDNPEDPDGPDNPPPPPPDTVWDGGGPTSTFDETITGGAP